MTDEEVQELLTALENLLLEMRLDFAVEQERILAVEGIPTAPAEGRQRGGRPQGHPDADVADIYSLPIPTIPTEPDRPSAYPAPRPRFSREDVVVTPLNSRQRLQLLLDLIEVATAGTVAMERAVSDELIRLWSTETDGHQTSATRDKGRWMEEAPWLETWDGSLEFSEPPEADLRGQRSEVWRIPDSQSLVTTASRARAVVDVLDALRAEAELSRNDWLEPRDATRGEDAWQPPRRRHGERG